MSSWWAMGGNAAYVWPSVAITLVVVGLNLYWARRADRRAEQMARRRAAAAKEQA